MCISLTKLHFLKEYHYDYSNGFIVKLKLKSLSSDNKRRELFHCSFFSITAVKLHKEKDKDYFSRLEKIDRTFIYADNEGYLYYTKEYCTG